MNDQPSVFKVGCAAIWLYLERLTKSQGASFKKNGPTIRIGSGKHARFAFPFSIDGEVTEIVVGREDIELCGSVRELPMAVPSSVDAGQPGFANA